MTKWQKEFYEEIPPVTLKRKGDVIEISTPGGAVIAKLWDDGLLTFDPFADTFALMDELKPEEILAHHKLDVETIRMIDSWPAPTHAY